MSGQKKWMIWIVGLVLALFMTSLTPPVWGQTETGNITGVVTDATGASVPNSAVKVVNTQTGLERSTTTDRSGEFHVVTLPPGEYSVEVEAPNFAKTKLRTEVSVGGHTTLNVSLEVGTSSTVIEVIGEGGIEVNTLNQEVGQVVSGKEIQDLPSLTRNPYDFVAFAPNVHADPAGNNFGYSLNGQRSSSVSVLLDGGENVNTFSAVVGQNVPLDSVQEFSVLTSDFSAEYGRASGGVVNVSTRSGTNQFHGSAYEFNRVSALSANTFDNNANGVQRPNFTRNQFGYSLGGPIKKNKLYFFSSTEWLRVRSSAEVQGVVFDPAFIAAGNIYSAPGLQNFYSTYAAEGLRPGTTILRTYTVNDLPTVKVYPIDYTDPNAHAPYLASLAGTNDGPNPVIFDKIAYRSNADVGAGAPENGWNTVFRGDYVLSDKTTLYGRYGYSHDYLFPGTNGAAGTPSNPYVGYDLDGTLANQSGLLSLTHLFSSALSITSKLEFIRFNETDPLPKKGVVPSLLISAFPGNAFDGLSFYVPGAGQGYGIFGGPQNSLSLHQDAIWTKGKHQLKIGGQYIYEQDNRSFGAYQSATEYGWRSSNNPRGLNNLIDPSSNNGGGRITRYRVAINPQGLLPCEKNPNGKFPPLGVATDSFGNNCTLNLPVSSPVFARSNRFNDAAVYAEDSWRVRRNLTINLGLRWEYFGVQHSTNDGGNLDSNFYFGPGSTVFDQIRNGQVYIAKHSSKGQLWNSSPANFGPRVGFAWDILGDGKTSLRGGYGISYERNYGNVTYNIIQNPPANATVDIRYGAGQDFAGNIPIQTQNFGPFSGTGQVLFKSPQLRAVDPNIKTAYAEFWSFGLDREVVRNTVLSVGYTGSHGVRLYSISNINEIGSGVVYEGTDPSVNPSDALNRSYTNINYRTNGGFSHYNALLVNLKSNNFANKGLLLNFSYTFAHAIDNLSQVFSAETAANGLGFLDPFKPNLDKGDSDFDVRHRVTLTAVWDVPLGRDSQGWLKQVIGGWQFAPTLLFRTGYPYTAYDCTNALVYNCPRFVPAPGAGAPSQTSTSTAVVSDVPSPNQWIYQSLPAGWTSYAEPLTGSGSLPTCDTATNSAGDTVSTGQNCHFPSNMYGRNTLRQPGIYNANLGVYKKFYLTERFSLQFRGEFYNLLNHSNFYLDSSAFADVSSGDSTKPFSVIGYRGGQGNGGDHRIVQLGLKLLF